MSKFPTMPLHLFSLSLKIVAVLCPLLLQAKVYDCFPFFNELELLQMRLEELDPVVDYFVLIESIETQRGDPKPLYFQNNKHLFKKYLPKIIHVILDERHAEMGLWQREHYQRECLLRGLTECKPWDQIILSDLDEIPRPSVIDSITIKTLPPKKKGGTPKRFISSTTYSLQVDTYYFQLNRQAENGEIWGGGLWFGPVVTSYENLKKHGPQYFRDHRSEFFRIWHAGWHFTWMGGLDRVRQKLLSVVEGRPMTDEEIRTWAQGHKPVPVDHTFPLYVQKNQTYLRSIGFLSD